jgi:hypothetical protein
MAVGGDGRIRCRETCEVGEALFVYDLSGREGACELVWIRDERRFVCSRNGLSSFSLDVHRDRHSGLMMILLVLVRRRIRISRVPDRAESIVDGDGDRSCCAEATFVAGGFFSFGAALVRLEAAFLCVVVVRGFVAGELDCLLLLSRGVSVCQGRIRHRH